MVDRETFRKEKNCSDNASGEKALAEYHPVVTSISVTFESQLALLKRVLIDKGSFDVIVIDRRAVNFRLVVPILRKEFPGAWIIVASNTSGVAEYRLILGHPVRADDYLLLIQNSEGRILDLLKRSLEKRKR